MDDFIKVHYMTREGYESTAYIDGGSGEGFNKHSDIPVTLALGDDGVWRQIDQREWRWNNFGEFEEVT